MPARQEVTFVIRARDATRAVLRRVGRSITGLRTRLIGLVGALGFGAITRDVLNFASGIDAASKRLDVNVRTLQALRTQAESANVPFETLTTVMQRLLSNAGAALAGSSDMAERFARLGLTLEDLDRLGADEILFRIAEAARDAGSDKTFRDALRDVGDTEIIRLLPLLRQGGARLAGETLRLIREGATLGQQAIEEGAAAEAQARQELAKAQTALRDALIEVIPALRDFAQTASALVVTLSKAETGPRDVAVGVADTVVDSVIDAGEAIASGARVLGRDVGREISGEAVIARLERAIARQERNSEQLAILRGIEQNTRETTATLGR